VLQTDNVTSDEAAVVLEQLRSWGSGEAAAEFKKAAHEKWPEVTRFA